MVLGRRVWFVVVALIGALVLPASSQSSLTVYVWRDADYAVQRAWWIAGRVEGAGAADVVRVDVYAYLDAHPGEQGYFLGPATLYPVNSATVAFTLRWPTTTTVAQSVPPTGRYRLEARAYTSPSEFVSGGAPPAGPLPPPYLVQDGKTQFVGNMNPDLLLHETATGFLKVWNMSAHRVAEEVPYTDDRGIRRIGIPDGWRIVGTGDWRHDARSPGSNTTPGGPDLLLQHDGGWLWLWLPYRWWPTQIYTTMYLEPSHPGDRNWRVEATADMNRDTWPDLIMRHQLTGDLQVKYMAYHRVTSTVPLDPSRLADTNWKIVGAADMNHDMWPDLVWQHQTLGYLMVFYMNGATMTSSDYLDPWRVSDPQWQVKSVVDLNNDSWPDLVWQHTGNNLSQVWFMRRNRLIGSEYISAGGSPYVPFGWEIVGPK